MWLVHSYKLFGHTAPTDSIDNGLEAVGESDKEIRMSI